MSMHPRELIQLYVSPDGKDTWSGALSEPAPDGSDGPLATIQAAQERIRCLRRRPRHLATPHTIGGLKGPLVVWLRGGRYAVREPVVFGPQDSAPVTYAAYGNEVPVIDGGQAVTGWSATTVNGRDAWVTDLPEVAAGEWSFRQLFVNGERRSRARLPKQGLFRMAEVPGMVLPAGWGGGGHTRFVCAEDDVKPFRNLGDVEVVYVHFWIEERPPIVSFDPETRLVTMARKSRSALVGSHGSQLADYYLDNVFEALTEPGEWYLDRSVGQLYYLPMPGESMGSTEIVAPRLLQLLRIKGDPEAGRYVEHVAFKGITFQHTDWRHPGETPEASVDLLTNPSVRGINRAGDAAAAQAAADVPGVIHFEGAKDCALEDCVVRNVGWYGAFISDGCTGIRLVGNEFYDLGAGGVKINGAAEGEAECRKTGWNRIADNLIHKAGRIFHSGVGILSMHSAGNVIAHNHIHDLFYSGISCGWVWGYIPSASHDNIIEKNHIHHIGQGLLSDMGGVYLLGIQPGTLVRNNLIHDVEKAHYGGWALYTDEGSSHIILENNVCYDTNGDVFHQHYGRENTVRNNILVCGAEATTAYTRIEPHVGVVFYRNILVSAGAPMFRQLCGDRTRRILSDCNLFWDTVRDTPLFCRDPAGNGELDLNAWRDLGHDRNSAVADPGFADFVKRDLSLSPDSPALRLGFRPIDISDVGPRPSGTRD